MDETTVFENFYANKIEPDLPLLRAEAKQADAWKFVGLLAGMLGFGSFMFSFADIADGESIVWLIIFSAALLILSVYQYARRKDKFTYDFKAGIIKKIIEEVCPGLVYKPGERVKTREYKTSGLYRHRHDYFEGDDLIEGVVENVSFHCSELHTQCDDGARNAQLTIFKGLFFVANISNRYAGGTYMWPRNGAQISGVMKEAYYRLAPLRSVVQMKFDDPEFDAYFRVFSTWPAQTHEILTAERRVQIMNMCTAINLPLSISFVSGKCFIGIPVNEDLLEPTNYDPGDKEEIKNYFITIGLIPNLIKQLGLSGLL